MCLLIKFLYWLFPIKGFRALLLRKHIERCSRCRGESEIEDTLVDILSVPEWIKKEPSLWPLIRNRITTPEKKDQKIRKGLFWATKWRWAAASVLIIGAVVFAIWNLQNLTQKIASQETQEPQKIQRISIRFAEVNGKKATPYVYQTKRISFIWFSETKKSGG